MGIKGWRMAKQLGYTERQIKERRRLLGQNLKIARESVAKMTQQQAMIALRGVENTRNRISEIENGHRDISLHDLLLLCELYGVSLDYVCGLSVEPEIDMVGGMVNHIVHQSRGMVEQLVSEFASVMVAHMQATCQNDSEILIDQAKKVCASVTEGRARSAKFEATDLMRTVRQIEQKQARRQMAIETQMMQVKERLDKEDGHMLLCDIDKPYQYSLPLPAPFYGENVVGVSE